MVVAYCVPGSRGSRWISLLSEEQARSSVDVAEVGDYFVGAVGGEVVDGPAAGGDAAGGEAGVVSGEDVAGGVADHDGFGCAQILRAPPCGADDFGARLGVAAVAAEAEKGPQARGRQLQLRAAH